MTYSRDEKKIELEELKSSVDGSLQPSDDEIVAFLSHSEKNLKKIKKFFLKLNRPLSKTILFHNLSDGVTILNLAACKDAELFKKIIQLTPPEILDEAIIQPFMLGFNILHLLAIFQKKHPACMIELFNKIGQQAADIALETVDQQNMNAIELIFLLHKREVKLAMLNKASPEVVDRTLVTSPTSNFSLLTKTLVEENDEIVIALLNKATSAGIKHAAFTLLFQDKYPLHMIVALNRSEAVINAFVSRFSKETFEELLLLQNSGKLPPLAYACGLEGTAPPAEIDKCENMAAVHLLNHLSPEQLPKIITQLTDTAHPQDKELNLLECAAFFNPYFFNTLINKLRKIEGDVATMNRIANNNRLLKRLSIENARPLLALDTDFELKIPDIERGKTTGKWSELIYWSKYGKKIDANWKAAGKENQTALHFLMQVYQCLDQLSIPTVISLITLQYLTQEDYMMVCIKNEIDKSLKKPFLTSVYRELHPYLIPSDNVTGKEKPELLVMEYLAPHPNVARAIFHEIEDEKQEFSKKAQHELSFFSKLISNKGSTEVKKQSQETKRLIP